MLMLHAIWRQQISVKRDKNFYLWSLFNACGEDTDDRSNLLFVTDRNSCAFPPTVDCFYSKISAEAPGRKIQFR